MLSEEERQAVSDALAALERDGRLMPEVVVDAARPDAHPLHRYFCWDDTVAAHRYRIDQARTLIRTVKVEVTTETRTLDCIRYVRDPKAETDEQGYVTVDALQRRPAEAAALLLYELGRVESLLSRAERLVEALGGSAGGGPGIHARLRRIQRGVADLARNVRNAPPPS